MDLYHRLFKDRRDAGRQLAAALLYLKEDAPIVLALPRGGVPVAFEVATVLHAPLDVLLVRKIGAPFSAELGLGAVVEGDPPRCVMNEDLMASVNPSDEYIRTEIQRQIEEMARRRALYCGERQRTDPRGRTVVVVDDGIATGGTMKAALQAVAQADPERLIFAVPVAPAETVESLYDDADEGVVLFTPPNFRAVSLYYDNFAQTTDDEVTTLLATPTRQAPGPAASPSVDPHLPPSPRH
ncbi:MAG: phosphoribosyltransferase [Noviherbaspirillum sp.]